MNESLVNHREMKRLRQGIVAMRDEMMRVRSKRADYLKYCLIESKRQMVVLSEHIDETEFEGSGVQNG